MLVQAGSHSTRGRGEIQRDFLGCLPRVSDRFFLRCFSRTLFHQCSTRRLISPSAGTSNPFDSAQLLHSYVNPPQHVAPNHHFSIPARSSAIRVSTWCWLRSRRGSSSATAARAANPWARGHRAPCHSRARPSGSTPSEILRMLGLGFVRLTSSYRAPHRGGARNRPDFNWHRLLNVPLGVNTRAPGSEACIRRRVAFGGRFSKIFAWPL